MITLVRFSFQDEDIYMQEQFLTALISDFNLFSHMEFLRQPRCH